MEMEQSSLASIARRNLVKSLGIRSDELLSDEVLYKLLDLKAENTRLKVNKRKVTIKQFITIVLAKVHFPTKQERLLLCLCSGKPRKVTDLMSDIGVKNRKPENLRALVVQTRKTIKKLGGEGIFIIIPLRGKPFRGYRLEVKSNLVKNVVTIM